MGGGGGVEKLLGTHPVHPDFCSYNQPVGQGDIYSHKHT